MVRHPDGQLKWADWSVLDRVVQIYKPTPGRKVIPPKMFEQEHLEVYLQDCVQCITQKENVSCVSYQFGTIVASFVEGYWFNIICVAI